MPGIEVAPEDALSKLYRTDEIAQYLRTDVQTVRKWVRTGQLRARWCGRQWLITLEALDEFLAASRA